MTADLRKKSQGEIDDAQPVQEQVRRRAYQLYEERGGEDGHDVEDWQRAEEEITGKKSRYVA